MSVIHPIAENAAPGPAIRHLYAVERRVLWLGALLLLGSLFVGGPSAQIGAVSGATLSLLNTWAIAALGRWASRGPKETARNRLIVLLGMFQLKLFVLAALIYLVLNIHRLPIAVPVAVSPLWFLVGLSLLPLGICALAVEYSLRQSNNGQKGE